PLHLCRPFLSFHSALFVSLFSLIVPSATVIYTLSLHDALPIFAWRFGLKTFVFLIICLWLLPAIIHLFNRNNESEKMSNNVWLTHLFGMNSISVVVAIICFLSSLLAPLIFMIIVLLLTLMQIALLIITMTIHFL